MKAIKILGIFGMMSLGAVLFFNCAKKQDDDLAMVFVKGGTFVMGCTSEQGDDCDRNESPTQRVTVSDFHIMKYEVTQKLWRDVTGNNPAFFALEEMDGVNKDRLPVESVSWNEIQEFISKLNEQTGKNYRLPTEAEWEFAARGGTLGKGFKYSGSNDLDEVAWYVSNSNRRLHEVGTKQPNELGIHDMSGNVWEWVNDYFAPYQGGSRTDPKGPAEGRSRVFRGGSWGIDSLGCRVAKRSHATPNGRNSYIGFRLVLGGGE